MASFKRRLSSPQKSPQTEDIEHELAQTRQLLKRYSSGIIHPRNSKWMHYWDSMSFACLFWTACITPVEVCILTPSDISTLPSRPAEFAMFITNRCVDVFFLMDMGINFFMAYQEPGFKGGMWVTQRAKIRRNYLRTWFTLDFVSVIPFDMLTRTGGEGSDDLSVLRVARIVRLLRLVKLLRILRASRIIARWQSFVGLSFAQLTMCKFFISTIFLVHFMACAWCYLGLNWVGTEGETLEWERSWIDYYNYGIQVGTDAKSYNIQLCVVPCSLLPPRACPARMLAPPRARAPCTHSWLTPQVDLAAPALHHRPARLRLLYVRIHRHDRTAQLLRVRPPDDTAVGAIPDALVSWCCAMRRYSHAPPRHAALLGAGTC